MLTNNPEEGTKADGKEDKGPVPLVVVVDGGHAEEHEDDGLRARAQHLEAVLEGRLRLGADVPLHVVLHRDAAEGDAENQNEMRK